MAVQGGNKIDHAPAYAGMVADLQLSNRTSQLVKGANVPFGYGVVRGAADGQVVLPTSGSVAGDFVGVAVYELNRAYTTGEVVGATKDMSGTFMTAGVIWASPAAAVADGDKVFLGVGATVAGRFTNAAGTAGTAAVEITGAKWLDTAASNGLSRVSLVIGG